MKHFFAEIRCAVQIEYPTAKPQPHLGTQLARKRARFGEHALAAFEAGIVDQAIGESWIAPRPKAAGNGWEFHRLRAGTFVSRLIPLIHLVKQYAENVGADME